jgi:hypothetical protein
VVITLSLSAQIRPVHLNISSSIVGSTWFVIDLDKEIEIMEDVFGFFVICL